jgi:hypothetical protein
MSAEVFELSEGMRFSCHATFALGSDALSFMSAWLPSFETVVTLRNAKGDTVVPTALIFKYLNPSLESAETASFCSLPG